MDLSQYVTQLRDDLSSAAAAGDEQTRRTAALLGAAIEPAARLALMNALSDLAAEVTAAIDDRVVEVRLDGRDVRVSVSADPTGPTAAPAADPDSPPLPDPTPFPGGPGRGFGGFGGFGGADAGDVSRITLRLVEQIKGQAEKAASAQGLSLNSWVAQAVQGALAGGGPGRWGGDGRGDGRDGEGRGRDGRGDRDGRRLRGWVQG